MESQFIIPLGTSSAMPVPDRHFSSLALRRNKEIVLFDCGEGTQLQLLRAGLPHVRISTILITHLHGDHIFGLFGLLATMTMLNRAKSLLIVGPEGIRSILESVNGRNPAYSLPFGVSYEELPADFEQGIVVNTNEYEIMAHAIDHRVPAVGYRYQEKETAGNLDVERARALGIEDFILYRKLKAGEAVQGKERIVQPDEVVGPATPGAVFAYVTDSRPCKGGRWLAQDADLLYHEATFLDEHQDRAEETGHSTAREAAGIARDSGVKYLLLGHFGARYEGVEDFLKEARLEFQNTDAAEELKLYPLVAAGAKDRPKSQTLP